MRTITNPDPEPDRILDSPHLSQRAKEEALVGWLFAKLEQTKPSRYPSVTDEET